MVSPKFVLHLMTRGLWLAGTAGVLIGLALQAVASHFAPLTLMLCLLTATVVLMVPIGALVERRRMAAMDLGGVALCALGVVGFVVLTRPHGGSSQVTGLAAARVGLVVAAAVTFCLLLARRTSGDPRAALMGISSGITIGTVDALVKTCSDILAGGTGRIFTSWPLYALAAVGVVSVLLEQSALRAGRLPASLSAISVLSPVVGIVIGAAVFHERLHIGRLLAFEILAALVAFSGILLLSSRAPSVPAQVD